MHSQVGYKYKKKNNVNTKFQICAEKNWKKNLTIEKKNTHIGHFSEAESKWNCKVPHKVQVETFSTRLLGWTSWNHRSSAPFSAAPLWEPSAEEGNPKHGAQVKP